MSDAPKSFQLSPEVHDYLVAHGSRPDEILSGLIAATKKLGGISIMQIAPEQGAFMSLFARAIGARRVIEVGTFTGLSTLCLARGIPDDGEVIACDISEEWTAIGRPFWERAGVAHKIDLRIGPAVDTLRALPGDENIDLSFIDADKVGYATYYQELLERTQPGGVILVDNVLWGGSVVDPTAQNDDVLAIRAFNDQVAADDRIDCVMLAISDGLSILRKH
ncbi:MAG: class I SAM-dependent methyltransferase [Deltaproteobacteria bacterium]|nr:class I SAM-dependent methyltransferase [Deltaproteobacteria bacterium]